MCDHHNNYVLDSRPGEFGIRRRRECADCGHRWTTVEIAFTEGMRGGIDPWTEYRRLAVRKWLEQQMKITDYRGGSERREEFLRQFDGEDWVEPN